MVTNDVEIKFKLKWSPSEKDLKHWFPNSGSGPICGSQTLLYGSLNIFVTQILFLTYHTFKTFSKKKQPTSFQEFKTNPIIYFKVISTNKSKKNLRNFIN